MSDIKPTKKKREFPNTTVIIFAFIVLVTILTYVVPAGKFGTRIDEATGIEMVDADSFERVEQTPVGPFKLFISIVQGFIDGGQVIFLILFGYFWVFSIVGSGAFSAGINRLLSSRVKDSKLLIPVIMIVLAIAGSTYGEMDTVYGLIPIFIGLSLALGYDAIVGMCMTTMATAVGFAAATTNPFTIGIAQPLAGLPAYSGLAYRIIIFIVFISVAIFYTMRYASKIKKDPTKSVLYGDDYSAFNFVDKGGNEEFTTKHKVLISSMLITVGVIVFGSLKLGWYLNEMSAVFLISGVIIQIIDRKSLNQIGESLGTALSEMANAMIVIGMSRAILVVLQEGNIIDSVIYALHLPMKNAPASIVGILMLFAQNILNFFIPSGSGQAMAIMPIMTPLADLAGLNRQIAVLAFQFGDGFSNLIIPNGVCAIMCGIAKVPLNKWYRFFLKLFGIMLILEIIFIVIAVAMNYGPF
ncbi:MAG: YfcC family protein [Lachnospiraceae bacterium]